MQNRKKRKDFREMEVSLETNKKGMEVFQRIKKKEKQGNRIRSLIIFIIIVEIILGISLFEFGVKTNRIPTFIGIILLIIMGFLSYVTYKLQQKLENMFSEYSIFNEIQFVNNILKENAKLRETALIPSGKQLYIEVNQGKNTNLVCVDDGNNPEEIEYCMVCYYKTMVLQHYANCIETKDQYRIFAKFAEPSKPILIKEN